MPGKRFTVIFYASMAILAALGFLFVYAFELTTSDDSGGWTWIVSLLACGLAGPFLLQYIVFRSIGVRPLRGTWRNESFLFSWWGAREHRFTRRQFVAAYGMPALFVYAIFLAMFVKFPSAAPVFGFVAPVYAGNLWYCILALRKPEGTLIGRTDKGVRFMRSAA